MNLGRREIQKAVLTSPWAVLMVPKSASLSTSVSLLSNKLDKQPTSVYRDDRLVLLRNTSKQKTDRIQKDIIETFKNSGFKIKIKTNLHIDNVLEVTFNLLD